MSSKRPAVSELNHDNWNDEEESEEFGEFKKASTEELERRVRRIAKRRFIGGSENSSTSNPFSGFGGFKATTGISASTPITNLSPFSFLEKIPSANGITEEKSDTQIEYLSKVKALNNAVAEWIKFHVDENPLIVLTPIFEDYEKYLKEFEDSKKSSNGAKEGANSKESEHKASPMAQANNFSFGKPSVPMGIAPLSQPLGSSISTESSNIFNSFKIGVDVAKIPLSVSPPKPIASSTEKGILFGNTSSPSTVSTSFSFGIHNATNPSTSLLGGFTSPTNSISFGDTHLVQASHSDSIKTQADEEDEEPPKNEFVPVVEEGSSYSKRCKIFVKGGSEFSDRGVGTLFIKKVEDSKIQLIVRNDTNLGKILLNIMIVENLPVSRSGKNNVMVVCIPTPDAKPPPTSVLIRVKTSEEADELFNKINDCKK